MGNEEQNFNHFPQKMGFQFAAPLCFLCLSLIAVSTAGSRRALEVGVYWSPDGNDGSLLEACDTANYQILAISFPISLRPRQTPEINSSAHCNSAAGGCPKFAQEITSCQALGIKVLLSLGAGAGSLDLNSTADATNFAAYLWNNFLGGESNSRPLNDAVFDGVDIANESSDWDNWSTLAKELRKLYGKQRKKFYLSAAPECSSLSSSPHTIPAPVVFDYIWVIFYGQNPSCQYAFGRLEAFWASWNTWKTFVAEKVFVELLAAPTAEGMGYIPPEVFRKEVLPELQRSSKFGGVMLWNRGIDRGYSSAINPRVCGSAGDESGTASDVAMFPMGGNFGGDRGFRTCRGNCVILWSKHLPQYL